MRYLYLHGFGSRGATSGKATWLAEKLETRGVELERPDLVPGEFSKMTLSGQLEVLTDLLRGEPCCLVGSSFGGLVGANYAQTHPEVEKLVLLAPAFGFPGRWVEKLGTKALEAWRESDALPVYHHADDREVGIHYQFYEDSLQHESCPAITQPTAIIHGLEDETVSIANSREFLLGSPQTNLVEVEGGHPLDSDEALEAIWSQVEQLFL